MNITLVLPRLGWGGGARSTLDLATAQMASAPAQYNFTLLVLGDSTPQLEAEALASGIRVVLQGHAADAENAVRSADMVHVNFWNTPEMYDWLRAPHPPMRVVLTTHVAGDYASQILTPPLLAYPDWLVTASPYTLELPLLKTRRADRTRAILPGTHLPASKIAPPPHTDFRIGYAGSVDFVKLSPRFVPLCAAVNAPRAKFPVAGGGDGFKTLRAQAAALGVSERFEWLGYRTDIIEVLASFDVLGYPLAPRGYGAGELTLQQAMWVGVPPVLFNESAPPLLVRDGETGILVRDETEYVAALENLSANEPERKWLSQNACAYARAHFGADKSALELSALYDEAVQEHKREHHWTGDLLDPRFPGASALIESFGSASEPYQSSLRAQDSETAAHAEYTIAHAPVQETNAGGGGILDYRRAYPQDPMLRLWTGLVLGQQSRYALAAAEFHTAQKMGLENPHLETYLNRMMQHQPLFAPDTNP